MLVRKVLVTLGCVAAIGMAGAGTASASPSQTHTGVRTQAFIKYYDTHDQCVKGAKKYSDIFGDKVKGWSCILDNENGKYGLRMW